MLINARAPSLINKEVVGGIGSLGANAKAKIAPNVVVGSDPLASVVSFSLGDNGLNPMVPLLEEELEVGVQVAT